MSLEHEHEDLSIEKMNFFKSGKGVAGERATMEQYTFLADLKISPNKID